MATSLMDGLPLSLERLQVRNELGDLGLAEAEVWHLRPGLHLGGVSQPTTQVVGVHIEGATGEARASKDVGQVRSNHALRDPLDRVASRTALCLEQVEPALGVRADRGGRR